MFQLQGLLDGFLLAVIAHHRLILEALQAGSVLSAFKKYFSFALQFSRDIIGIKHCVSIRWTTCWFDTFVHYKIITTIVLANTSRIPHNYLFLFSGENIEDFSQQLSDKLYSIIKYKHSVVCYITRTYSTYNWKIVHFYQYLSIVPNPTQPTRVWCPPF